MPSPTGSVGKSHEARDLWAVKVSDNVGADENEPEVLFTCNQLAREHLTVEMCLYIVNERTGKYASDPRIKAIVDTREIWIVFMVNPDGVEYDIASGSYRSWRKNRQPNNGSPNVGTDLNRNWDCNWGCCNGSSGNTASLTYRGPSAFSAPETHVVADFVNTRVIDGKQQIKANIDFHSELVLWPYGYTYNDLGPGLTQDDRGAHVTLGKQMANTNGYTPEQASGLYITDGTIDDWMWGVHKDFSYTFEMYPTGAGGGGFYPPGSVIGRETWRNWEGGAHASGSLRLHLQGDQQGDAVRHPRRLVCHFAASSCASTPGTPVRPKNWCRWRCDLAQRGGSGHRLRKTTLPAAVVGQ